MELSLDMPNLEHQFNALDDDEDTLIASPLPSVSRPVFKESSPEILDLSTLHFLDDENWLIASNAKSEDDLHKWLYSTDNLSGSDLNSSQFLIKSKSDFQKNIDTRTFTRPKKRLTRPSIEKYNEELYGSDKLTDSGIQINGFSQDDSNETTPTKPLHFDLTQPMTSFYFDNILANAPMVDSFQNMSPPSLVNSMCSSTFANLMESSFIKNDPVLREIRDTDFTESVLLQDTEPVMYQSVAESCSSINSDAPENFLKKVSFNDTFKKKFTRLTDDATSDRKDIDEMLNALSVEDINIEAELENVTITPENLNGTYQRKPRTKSTFRVADLNNGTFKLNHTFKRTKNLEDVILPPENLNSTITLKPENEMLNSTAKRLLDRRPSPSLDLNRLSYDDKKENHHNENNKRNSFGSTDSAENLDYMSLSSGSSKSSHKILSMEGINAIVEMQERSLLQIMSTPKPNAKAKILWENNVISPISGRNSDPELSSNEFAIDPPILNTNTITKQKSLGNINALKGQQKLNPVSKLQSMATNIRGSYPNLKLPPNSSNKATQRSKTNLKSMGPILKGSYTSLKPMNTNLPVAPPLDSTITVQKGATQVIAQVPPIPREIPRNHDFVKPQPPRSSGLPRPVSAATGIPRPFSRIPGPRSLRPPSKSTTQQGRQINY